MKIKKVFVSFLLLSIVVLNTQAYWEDHDIYGHYMFGYAGVGDDPTLYMPEVESNRIPTNVQSIVVNTSTDNLASRINYLNSRGQKAIIVLDNLLFLKDSALATPCGVESWRNRLDYQAKFTTWFNINAAILVPGKVAVLVINTEVNNRCIPYTSLDIVTQYVVSRIPSIPTVAGYGRSTGAQPLPAVVPASLAGVLLFKYQVLDPRTDSAYQQELTNLKAKLTSAQRIILVPDGFYSDAHAQMGWARWYLGYLALNYAELAKNDPKVVGLVFFLWPSFTEGSLNEGTRDLPQSVRDRQRLASCGMNIQSPLLMTC
jgi:hypothetical protein